MCTACHIPFNLFISYLPLPQHASEGHNSHSTIGTASITHRIQDSGRFSNWTMTKSPTTQSLDTLPSDHTPKGPCGTKVLTVSASSNTIVKPQLLSHCGFINEKPSLLSDNQDDATFHRDWFQGDEQIEYEREHPDQVYHVLKLCFAWVPADLSPCEEVLPKRTRLPDAPQDRRDSDLVAKVPH